MGWAHKLGANSQKESSRKNSIMGIGWVRPCIPSFAVQSFNSHLIWASIITEEKCTKTEKYFDFFQFFCRFASLTMKSCFVRTLL